MLFLFLEVVMVRHPIYTAALAMLSVCIASGHRRPDRWQPMMPGAVIFTFLNFVYFSCLVVFFSGLCRLYLATKYRSGWLLAGVPMEEELLFTGTFGLMWCSLYKYFYWQKCLARLIR